MQPLEETLKSKLVDLIRESQQAILNEFKAGKSSSHPAECVAPSNKPFMVDRGGYHPRHNQFSNQMIARDFLNQPTSTVPAQPPMLENNQQWDLLSSPPLINPSDLAHELNSMLPVDASRAQASDSGYGSTICMRTSSDNQAFCSLGSLNPAQSYTDPSQELTTQSSTSVDDTGNIDFDSWNQDSSLGNRFDFKFPKCGNCGGDVLDMFDTSSYFIDME